MTDSARTISRRSITKGAAWATPVVAVGLAAPHAAATPPPGCIEFSIEQSGCKCPGSNSNFKYYFTLCAKAKPNCTVPTGTKICITNLQKDNGGLVLPVNYALPFELEIGSCIPLVFESSNSGAWINFDYTIGSTSDTGQAKMPPNLGDCSKC